MFPFVILSQKQRIKRYNLQFGGKEKHCTSLQSLKIFFFTPQKSRKADLMTCTAVLKSRILLPNSLSSKLRAWTNPAGQIQQVNHGIFSKYFEKTKQEKNQNQNKQPTQTGQLRHCLKRKSLFVFLCSQRYLVLDFLVSKKVKSP